MDVNEGQYPKLETAYQRYTEIVNDTYSAEFDNKRKAAQKEAASYGGVKTSELKRYVTARALNIPFDIVRNSDNKVAEYE